MTATYTNTVAVYEDAQKRWIPTRRIWNQHAYHVTNVREDGTHPGAPEAELVEPQHVPHERRGASRPELRPASA